MIFFLRLGLSMALEFKIKNVFFFLFLVAIPLYLLVIGYFKTYCKVLKSRENARAKKTNATKLQ